MLMEGKEAKQAVCLSLSAERTSRPRGKEAAPRRPKHPAAEQPAAGPR
jgi:hypothetical protein